MKNKRFKIKKNLLNTVLRRFTNSNRHYTVRAYHYIPSVRDDANIYRRFYKSRATNVYGWYNKTIKYEVCCPDFPCLLDAIDGSLTKHYCSMYGDEVVLSSAKPINLHISFTADSPSERFIPAYWNRIYNHNSLPVIYDQYSKHNFYFNPTELRDFDEIKENILVHPEWSTRLYSKIGYMIWLEDAQEYTYVFPFNNSNRIDDTASAVYESSETLKEGIYIFNFNNKAYAASIGKWDNILPVYDEPIIIALDTPDYREVTLGALLNRSEPGTEVQYINATESLFHRAQGFLYYPVKLPTPMLTHLLPRITSYRTSNYSYNDIIVTSPAVYSSDTVFGRILYPYIIEWAGQKLYVEDVGDTMYSLMKDPRVLTPSGKQSIFNDPDDPDASLELFQPKDIPAGPYHNSYYNGKSLNNVTFEEAQIGFISWHDVWLKRNHETFVTNSYGLYCIKRDQLTFSSSYNDEVLDTDYVRVMYVNCSLFPGDADMVKFKVIDILDYSHQPYMNDCYIDYKNGGTNENFIYGHVLVYNSFTLGKQFIG